MINYNQIYTAQGYIDENIVKEKQEKKDYTIAVEMIDDDGEMIAMLVDGNHSFQAAKRDGIEPEIIIVNNSHKSLVDYVTAMNDLSNPVNIITGKELW